MDLNSKEGEQSILSVKEDKKQKEEETVKEDMFCKSWNKFKIVENVKEYYLEREDINLNEGKNCIRGYYL